MSRIIIFILWAFIFGIQVNCQTNKNCPGINCHPPNRPDSQVFATEDIVAQGSGCPRVKCVSAPSEDCVTIPTFYPLNNVVCSGCPRFVCTGDSAQLFAGEDSEQKLEECPTITCFPLPDNIDIADCTATEHTFETSSGKICPGCPTYECTEPVSEEKCPTPNCDPLAFPPEVNVERDCNKTEHTFEFGNLICTGCPIYECQIPATSTEEVCPDTYCTVLSLPQGLTISDCVKTPTFFQLKHLTCEGCPTYECTVPPPPPFKFSAAEDSGAKVSDAPTPSSFSLSAGAALGIGIAGGFVVALVVAFIIITVTKKNKNYNEIL